MNRHRLWFRVFGLSVSIQWRGWIAPKIAKYGLAAPKPVPALERSLLRKINSALREEAAVEERPLFAPNPGRSTWPRDSEFVAAGDGRFVPACSNN